MIYIDDLLKSSINFLNFPIRFLLFCDNDHYIICKILFVQSYETKKKGVGKVEEKQAILHEEGKMDDGLDFSRSQEEESRTARVIRKCSSLFTKFIK